MCGEVAYLGTCEAQDGDIDGELVDDVHIVLWSSKNKTKGKVDPSQHRANKEKTSKERSWQ